MSISPMFARYLKVGDIIPHPIEEYGEGRIVELRFSPPEKTPGRPWGVVSGMMTCGGCKISQNHVHGFSYPADRLLPALR